MMAPPPPIPVELLLLAASIVLGLVHLVAVSHLQSRQRGYRWTAGSRDGTPAPLTGLAGRAERSLRNYLETFPLFAAAVLAAAASHSHGWMTVTGAHLYLWGRIGYAAAYLLDLPLTRSLVWNVPTAGILMIVAALFV